MVNDIVYIRSYCVRLVPGYIKRREAASGSQNGNPERFYLPAAGERPVAKLKPRPYTVYWPTIQLKQGSGWDEKFGAACCSI